MPPHTEPRNAHRAKWSIGKSVLALVCRIEAWIVLSLIFIALMRLTSPDSPEATDLWFLDPLLSILFLAMIWLKRRIQFPRRLKLSRMWAAFAFILISWIIGMLTELSISTGAGGYGGLHEKTIPSFILAQGYYIPLAAFGLWLVRRYHITFAELFFVAGMTSIYEILVLGIPVLISPAFLMSPIVIAFYFVIYSRLLSMVVLFIDEELLWSRDRREISFRRKLLYGSFLGIVCWIVFVAWAAVMDFVFDGYQSF